jgi:hypothetical protein
MDIGAWLRGLALGQYEYAFRANDADALGQKLVSERLSHFDQAPGALPAALNRRA